MTTQISSPDRQYRIGTFVTMSAYVLALFPAVFLLSRDMVTGFWVYPLAILPAVPIIGQLLVTLRYLRDADEFVRVLLAKRVIVGAMAAFGVVTTWGFLESFAEVPHLPGIWGYCLMWAFTGLASVFIKDSK